MPENTATFHFIKAGLQTLIQDKGRVGYQSFGVPVSGALDKKSAALANELVGNSIDSPVIEMALLGAKIWIKGDCQIAITGADMSPKIDGQIVPNYTTITIKKEAVLSFRGAKSGCRTYIGIGGQWEIPQWLDSCSALPNSGEAATPKSLIQKESVLIIKTTPPIAIKSIAKEAQPTFLKSLRIRVLPGPEFEEFSKLTIAYFFSRGYRLTNDSNRMGYRLDASIIDFKPKREVISSGIVPGTIQITNAGQPVILMADAQTVGGYYRMANVISTDLDKLAQLRPGDEVWFSLIRLEDIL